MKTNQLLRVFIMGYDQMFLITNLLEADIGWECNLYLLIIPRVPGWNCMTVRWYTPTWLHAWCDDDDGLTRRRRRMSSQLLRFKIMNVMTDDNKKHDQWDKKKYRRYFQKLKSCYCACLRMWLISPMRDPQSLLHTLHVNVFCVGNCCCCWLDVLYNIQTDVN